LISRLDKLNRLKDNILDMKKRGYLPLHTQGYFSTDMKNLNYMLDATLKQKHQEWKCPECNFVCFGPKKLMLEHHKIHSMKKEIRENEVYQRDYKIY